jgi:Ca2+-binding EF-hand superfamily protein
LQRNGRCSVQRALQHDWLTTTTTNTNTGNLEQDMAVSAIPLVQQPQMEHGRTCRQPQQPTTAEMATVILSKKLEEKKSKLKNKMKQWTVKIPSTPPPHEPPWSMTTPATAAMTPESCGTMTIGDDDRAEDRCHFVNSPISIVDDPTVAAEETTTSATTRTATTRATRSSAVNEIGKKQQQQQSKRTNLDDFFLSSTNSSTTVVPDEFKALREAFDDLKSAHTDVTAKDLKAILRQRKKYTEEEVETWFDRANLVEDSRKVKFTELLTEAIHSRRRIERARVNEAFQFIDKDRQGFVTVGNLRAILGTKNSDYIEILIKEADQKRDGRIRYGAFQEVLNRWNEREESGSLL